MIASNFIVILSHATQLTHHHNAIEYTKYVYSVAPAASKTVHQKHAVLLAITHSTRTEAESKTFKAPHHDILLQSHQGRADGARDQFSVPPSPATMHHCPDFPLISLYHVRLRTRPSYCKASVQS